MVLRFLKKEFPSSETTNKDEIVIYLPPSKVKKGIQKTARFEDLIYREPSVEFAGVRKN